MKKRIVAMLLALIMLLGLLPMSVFAVDADAGLNDTGDNEAVGYDTGDGNVNPIDTGNSVPKAPIATKLLQTVYFICSGGETISPATDVKVLNSGIQKGTTYRADVDKDFLNAVLNEKGLSDHTLGNYTTSVTYSWNTDKQTWETSDTVSVNLTHPPIEIDPDVIPAPTKPSKPKLSEEGSPVLVHCENRSNEHASTSCQDIYLDTTNSARYTEVTVNGENVWKDADGEWTYRIKLNKDEYIKAFNKNPNINTTHTDTNPGEETYVTWKHDGTSWKLVLAAGQSAGVGAVINVKCTPVPTSDEPTLANTDLKLIVKCVTNKAAHSERSMPLKAGTFKMNGTVQDRSQLKFCTIEVETAQYVAEFDTGHTAKQPSLTITLYQNPTTGRWNNNQTLGTVDNVIEVTCEPEAPTADELKKLEMAVQVKCVVDELQQHKDGYDLLGEYNKDYFVNEPRKVGDDWFCDISYIPDLYVAKFNKAFPNLKHVQNIEKIDPVTLRWDGNSWQPKKQGLVPVTEVYTVTFDSNGGTPVPPKKEVEYGLTATEPAAPEKTGYTFDGWYLGDEKYDFSAAVKQNITLKAKWSPATVYLFVQPVDSGNNPLTGKNALNAATLARAGFKASTFGGYNYSNKEWITVGKMTTALKLPTYKSVTDITGIWLDAVKGELKNGTYTPHANAADFNAKSQGCVDWNNLKYMPASCSHYGYPGKSEGYHLDGKLTFYWVKFDGNGATPESMPKNNYGDVYDYYITGGKVTMPAAPTRDGYTFDGWYLDGAEAPFDFNSTITSDITLTAKWKLNTYTLCTTLKLNGSDTAYKVPDRDFSWTYRESGEKDTDINYASFKNVLAAKAREIDAANSPSEKQIDIVFSVGKIADVEQEIKKYGQEGINWQPNNKNTAYVSASVYTYYDVTFMDGDTTLGTKTVKCGDTVSFADPTKNGYNFTGWKVLNADGTLGDAFDPANDVVTHKMTLVATWEKKEYTVTATLFLNGTNTGTNKSVKGLYDTNINYDGEDGLKAQLKAAALAADAANEPNQDRVDIEICLNDPSKAPFTATKYGEIGYNWRDMEWTNPTTGVTNKWIVAYTWAYVYTYYDVTFMDGDTTLGTETVKCGEKLTFADPTKYGYNFTGWKVLNADGTLGDAFDPANDVVTHKMTLVATWEKKEYTVTATLFLNGTNTGTNKSVKGLYDTNINYDGEDGLKAQLKAAALAADAANEPNQDRVDIEICLNDPSKAPFTATKYGEIGYNWRDMEWTNPTTGAVKKWIVAYTWAHVDTYYDVTFMDGNTTLGTKTVKCGDTVSFADPTKNGYNFTGWYTAAEGGDKVELTTPVTKSMTLYAHWTPNTYRYEIHYFLQAPDGSYVEKEVDKTPTGVFDTTVTITPDANKYGAHYPYNSVKSVVSGVVTVDDPATILKLYVYYDLDFHTLTFDTMGGSRIDPVKVRHGNAVAKPKDPVNGGYWFDGWYTDKTYRTPYNFATPLTQDTTIYAKWFLIVLPGVTIKKATPKLNTYDHFAYVQGYPDGTVKPAGNITRAETAAILFRLMDNSSRKTYLSTKSGFRDVTASSWYNTYVATLNNAGVITDSANGYFRPNEAITRAELAAMLASFTETTRAANYFDDVSANHWAANAIAVCAKLGWITGYPDGSFRPDRNVTRAELMAMINRATGRAPKSADAFLPGMKTWSDNTADKWYYLDVQEATNSHSYAVSPTELWTALTAAPDWSRYE